MTFRVHDLLRLTGLAALRFDEAPPEWVQRALAPAPWVVVCRRGFQGGLVPVGIRGQARHQRQLAWLPQDAVAECVTPEMLGVRVLRPLTGFGSPIPHQPDAQARDALRPLTGFGSPVMSALKSAAAICQAFDLSWGPTGSVAFELVSGQVATSPVSDLDLLLRPEEPLSRECARKIAAAFAVLPLRTDVLVETMDGGMSLADLASDAPEVVLRTLDGPRRVFCAPPHLDLG